MKRHPKKRYKLYTFFAKLPDQLYTVSALNRDMAINIARRTWGKRVILGTCRRDWAFEQHRTEPIQPGQKIHMTP